MRMWKLLICLMIITALVIWGSIVMAGMPVPEQVTAEAYHSDFISLYHLDQA